MCRAPCFNGDDAVLLIMKNGYTSATGTQDIISTPDDEIKERAEDKQQPAWCTRTRRSKARSRAWGCAWLRTVDNYDVATMRRTLEEAFTSSFNGLKVIIAEGECQLERQRRIKPWIASLLKAGQSG